VSDSTTLAETDAPTEAPHEAPAVEPPAPEPPAAEAPVTEAPTGGSAWAGPATGTPATTAEAAPPAPPEQPPAPVPAAPAAQPSRKSVAIPMWLLGIVAVAVLVVGAFFVGRQTAPETSGPTTLAQAVEETASGDMPVGDFNLQDLVAALQQNGNLNFDLGDILDILGGNNR
jgi:hypothetical protein